MSEQNNTQLEATPEQVLYAKILNKGMLVGLVILFITYAIYVLGFMQPHVPLDQLDQYWSLSVGEYLHAIDVHAGWSWTGMLNRGDFLNFVGIVILAGVTILCYIAIIPTLLKNKDKIFALIAALEVIVLVLAAAGVVGGGH